MTNVDTSAELARTTQTIDATSWETIYVIGDVHGCANELRTMLSRLRPSSDDLVLFTGDLIRKGPSSDEVVDIVRANPNYRSVKGNNEAKLLRGSVDVDELDENDVEWLASRPNAIAWDDNLVVHGGVDPHAPVQSPVTVRNVRSLADNAGYGNPPYWWQLHEKPPRVFFGHTVFSEPLVTPSAVGLDTGCVYGGALTAYNASDDTITQVISDRTVQERPDSAILDPNNVSTDNNHNDG